MRIVLEFHCYKVETQCITSVQKLGKRQSKFKCELFKILIFEENK
jgi:hypothetical protein